MALRVWVTLEVKYGIARIEFNHTFQSLDVGGNSQTNNKPRTVFSHSCSRHAAIALITNIYIQTGHHQVHKGTF